METLYLQDAILQYETDAVPAPGKTVAIAPGIRWVRMPMPGALNHINLWLLADGEGWTQVDTGMATDETRQYWETLLPEHPVSRLVVTHLHPDHLGLSAWLQEKTGAPLYMTAAEFTTAQLMRREIGSWAFAASQAFFRQHGGDDALQAALDARAPSYARGVPAMPDTYRRLRHGDVLRIGGDDWRIIVGSGHSPEHACLYSAAQGVLISGDMILPRISTNVGVPPSTPDDDTLALYLESIHRLRELPADTLVLPSHGQPFRGLHLRIDQLAAHHAERCDTLVAACSEPRTALDLLPILFERPLFDAHQIFFALSEAIAHLNYLVVRGRLARHTDQSVFRYSRI